MQRIMKSSFLSGFLAFLLFSPVMGGPNIGEPAPDFTLQEVDGGNITLSDYLGKVVILNFWNSF